MQGLAPMIESFEYPEMPWSPERDGLPEAELSARFAKIFPTGHASQGPHNDHCEPASGVASVPGEEQHVHELAEACRIAEERGRREGIDLGVARALHQAREEALRQLQGERTRLLDQGRALAASFADSRDGYLHEFEHESVRLALAIAARILRREAHIDPLLLTGAVRVALGQLAESTAVRLRVPEPDAAMWQEALRVIPGLTMRPEVVADAEMSLGECRIETELGNADLGLWAQLKEIERGFFDRVGEFPGSGGAQRSESDGKGDFTEARR